MKCPFCNSNKSWVFETRSHQMGIRRRRECVVCKKRFTTLENLYIDPYVKGATLDILKNALKPETK